MADSGLSGRRPRVLVQLPNWLGDVVMSTPLLHYLNAAFSAVDPARRPELHLAVRRPWAPLFIHDTRIADVILVERNGAHRGLFGLWRQGMAMRRGTYDAILIGPPSLRAGLTAFLADAPLRIGYDSDARGCLLKPALVTGQRGDRHFACEMRDLGAALVAAWGLDPPTMEVEGLPAPSLVKPVPRAVPVADPLWIVAPGTTYGEAKVWPLGPVGDFVDLAVANVGARVVLLGDQHATEFVATMRERSTRTWSSRLDTGAEVTDLTGQTSLAEVTDIMHSAAAFVGNDSGLMHLAAAFGVPTVGVFGSSNPAWTHPLGAHTAVVVASGFPCQPCYRACCNQSRFCLDTVRASHVLDVLLALLAEQTAAGEGF